MDERLKNAAIQGDVAFLREAIASQKPLEYFQLKYVPRYGAKEVGGNIFHLAALDERVEFIREALELLPFLVVHKLLRQTNNQGKTPLDEDFLLKHNEIAPLLKDFYERNNSMDRQLKNAATQGDVEFLKQAVASEKPPEYFKSRYVPCPAWEDKHGGNIFRLAAYHRRVEFFKAAMEILPLSELDLDILLWQSPDFGVSLNPLTVLSIAKQVDSGSEIVELIEGIYTRRNTMDPQLKEAAIKGDIKFLRDAIASHKPVEYFQSLCCVPDPHYRGQVGNIFHLAARNKRGEFLREAMGKLSQTGVDVHLLLCQQDHPKWERNPLHVAAGEGYNKIVKVILDYYEKSLSAPANSSPPPSSSTSSAQSTNAMDCRSVKPWLAKDAWGCTPFYYVMEYCREECVLKLLSIDSSLFSHMDDCVNNAEDSLFVVALQRGFSKVVFKFWESAPNWQTFDKRVLACALAHAPNCSDEIFRLVLEQNLLVIKGTDFYRIWSPLRSWAWIGKLYPFEYVLKEEVCATDLRRCIVEMIFEENPLLYVAQSDCDEDRGVQIARILVDACEKEMEQPNGVKLEQPWFARDRIFGETVLHKAIKNRREKVALHFLSLKKVELLLAEDNRSLFLSIKHKCHDVAQKILDLVDQHGLKTLLTSDTGRTVLHDIPKCKGDFVKQVVKRYPELLKQTDDDGVTVLHSWMEIGKLWPFRCILNKDEFSNDIRRDFLTLLTKATDDESKNPLHVAAESAAKGGTDRIVRFLFSAIRKQDLRWACILALEQGDSQGNTPVEIALSNRREELALCLLSELLTVDGPNHLFKAVDKQCHSVVKFLLDKIHQSPELRPCLDVGKQNVLHIASKCTEENAKLMVERWPELIKGVDEDGKTPLERASEAGTNWLLKLILQKERSSILKAPKAWVEPCERGDLSTILAFAENTYFKYICREQKDTPLHHVKFKDYNEYQKLLECELVKELKNAQDFQGDTPLHKAIKNQNKDLTEILLNMEDVKWNIKNKDGKTAMDLLEEASKDTEWAKFCSALGVDPRLKITYIQSKKDVTQMRETISLVAALLATITFTAGFTLPGGFSSENGEAVLAKKAAFLVFLIADTYAMCCSMLILFSIVWSMVCDSKKSSFLADRSLELLKHSLYGTFLAFMTGVYTVTYKKSLWMAIMVIVMCSLTIMLAQRRILHKMFEIMNSVTEKAHKMQRQWPSSWEQWASNVKSWGNRRPIASSNQGQDEEAAPLTNQCIHHEISTPANNQCQDEEAATLTNQSEHQVGSTLGEPRESRLVSIV